MPVRDVLFGFRGRLRRRDWWLWSIGLGVTQILTAEIVNLVLFGPTHSLLGGTGQAAAQRATDTGPVAVLWVITLAFLWPWLALSVKRAHDRDGRGVVAAICLLIATIRLPPDFYADAGAKLDAGLWSWLPMTLAAFGLIAAQAYLVVTLGVLDGTKGPNRYGPSPKGSGSDAAAVFD